ncbi:hypothetical protein D3C81_1634950 [compost metagenome]
MAVEFSWLDAVVIDLGEKGNLARPFGVPGDVVAFQHCVRKVSAKNGRVFG